MSFFVWLENTWLSTWIRESPSLIAFPFILYLHTLGLALVAGLSSAVALTILAVPGARPAFMYRLFPFMWAGLAINAVSGLLLLIAYPAKALTNPVFYIKLGAIAVAIGIVQWLQGRFLATEATADPKLKRAAWALLGLWLIATLTGRLLAYTHSILLATIEVL